MIFADRLTLDAPKRTRDGYMAVRARAARVGVYQYAGSEIDPNNEHGLRDKALVNVLRDENTVFDRAAMQSFIGKPVTDDHPTEAVTADNWKQHARGTIMGVARDGDYQAFDILLTDGPTIAKVDGGKRELSNGYGAELEFGQFTAKDGTLCDARQSKITGGNHCALVDRGRAGSDCAIKDIAVCDAITADRLDELKANLDHKEPVMAGTIIVDGLPVSLADEAAVRAVIEKKDAAVAAAEKSLTDEQAKVSTLTGEKAVLEKSLTDAKAELDPAKIDARVADRSALIAKAKALKSDIVTDGKADADIRKEVVSAKLGDAAASLDDAAVIGAFAALTADADSSKVEGFTPAAVKDAAASEAKALNDSIDDLNAWRTQRPAAA